MAKQPLDINSQFVVGENKGMAYVLAILFFALFGYGLYDAIRLNFKNIDYQSYVFALAIFPAIALLKRASSKKVYIRVNQKGIYQDERLVTNWDNFIKATISQKEKKKIINLQDNFILIVDYRKEGKGGFRRKIPLTNNQNKAEEEVLEAVRFFWKAHLQRQ